MNTAETLRAAALRVREIWAQGTDGSDVCALGALAHVRGLGCDTFAIYGGENIDLAAVVVRALNLPYGEGLHDYVGRVYRWNDAEEQTAENVAAGLEYAAIYWEQEQARAAEAQPAMIEAQP